MGTLDEAAARRTVGEIMAKTAAVLGTPLGRGERPEPYESACTDGGGGRTGQVQVGEVLNRSGVPREVGVADLRRIRQLWVDADYKVGQDGEWDRETIDLLFRDEATGIRLGASLNAAGAFNVGVITGCLSPDTPKASAAREGSAPPPAPGGGDMAHIRDALG